MNENDKKLPPWFKNIQDSIKNARDNFITLSTYGGNLIKHGLEISKYANERLQEIEYADRLLNQSFPDYILTDSIVSVSGESLSIIAGLLSQQSNKIYDWYEKSAKEESERHKQFYVLTDTTSVSSTSVVYLGAEFEKRIETLIPTYEPIYKTTMPAHIPSREQIYKDLHAIIKDYGPKFLNMLEGSEDALNKRSIDNLSQATHSMRDLFQQLIEYLAPTDAVKSQIWFKPTPEAPNGVSRRSRLKYLLHGSGSALSEDTINYLDEIAEQAKTALDLSINRAHNHDPQLKFEEVQLAIDHARYWLLEVLKRYKSRQIKMSVPTKN